MMWYKIFRFELQYRKKRPATYIYLALTFLMSILVLSSPAIKKLGAAGLIKENAPVVVSYFMAKASLFLALLASAIMGVPVLRDYEYGTDSLIFVNPIKKRDYLLGRFLGSFFILFLISLMVPLAGIIGEFMPWRNPENLLSFNLETYTSSYLYFILPNIFFIGVLFFSGGTLSKKNIIVYTQGIFLLVLMLVAQSLISKIDNRFFASILDPFGSTAIKNQSVYWSVADRNSLMLSINGEVLINRLAWISIALGSLFFTLKKFSFNIIKSSKKNRKAKEISQNNIHIEIKMPKANISFGFLSNVYKVFRMSWFYSRGLFKELSFIAIILSGLALLIVSSLSVGFRFGHVVYPTTAAVINMLTIFEIFFVIILVFFTGELIWKERNLKFNQIYDSLPVPDIVGITGKFFGLVITYIILLLSLIVMGVIIQIAHGYYDIEFALYFKTLFTETFLFIVFYTLMAFFIQAIVNHKFLGYVLVIIFFIVIDFFPEWGWEHSLLSFAEATLGTYSDMNKFGHFVNSFTWENVYWFGFSSLIFILSVFVSARGTDSMFKYRIRTGKYKFTRPLLILTFTSLMVFALSGCYIYYNTNVLNEHITSKDFDKYKAEYEKTLSRFEYIPQPTISDINLNVELYPQQRNFRAKGYYILKNRTNQAIDEIHIQSTFERQVKLNNIEFEGGAETDNQYSKFKYFIYKLNTPILPEATIKMEFEVDFITQGFVDNMANTDVVFNGTFFNNSYFPKIGYNSYYELDDDKKRKKYGLLPKERMLSRDSEIGRTTPAYGTNVSSVKFEIVVGTSNNQIALAPGYLINTYKKDGRSYYHYKMDAPIHNFYSIVSADYEVLRGRWNGINLEIYYHKGHEYNIDRMMNSMKKSLEYFSKAFGPYQYRQLRIMEFPQYENFAQSFANTIPFSEGMGFIMDVENSEYDKPFYVTAHEVGHQWWGHQVLEANTKGSTFLSEAITQYSAMMVMKHTYPKEDIQKYLRYELDRYLTGRANESKKELPLIDVENQGYIHYNKGAVIMYAFQDYISEDSVNVALRRYLKEWKFREDLYPTSGDLLKEFEKVTPDSLQYLLTDFFETITMYENKTEEVNAKQLSDNKYKVDFTIQSQKFRADSIGNETEIELNDWIDIGIYKEDENGKEKLIYLKKHKLDKTSNTISVTVNEKPVKAGIDPLNKLIDRHPEDNVKQVKFI